jgi:hypothetical protein
MKEFLLVEGVVPESWIDPQSRRTRFCDGVPDQFIRNYDDLTLSIL